jgi:hypothetical protein
MLNLGEPGEPGGNLGTDDDKYRENIAKARKHYFRMSPGINF